MRKEYLTKIVVDTARKQDIDCIVDFQITMAKESEGLDLDKSTVKNGVSKVIEYIYILVITTSLMIPRIPSADQ